MVASPRALDGRNVERMREEVTKTADHFTVEEVTSCSGYTYFNVRGRAGRPAIAAPPKPGPAPRPAEGVGDLITPGVIKPPPGDRR